MNYTRKSILQEMQITPSQLVAAMHKLGITPFRSGNGYTSFSDDQAEALRSYCRVHHPFKTTLISALKHQEEMVNDDPSIENIRKLHELRLKFKQSTGSSVMTASVVSDRPVLCKNQERIEISTFLRHFYNLRGQYTTEKITRS